MTVHAAIAGASVIFLDTAADRFFALPDGQNELALRLASVGVLSERDHAALLGALDDDMAAALTALRSGDRYLARPGVAICSVTESASYKLVIAALCRILWTRVALWLFGLDRMLASIHSTDRRHAASDEASIILAHRATGRWSSRHDDCLVRSIALTHDLRAHGVPATLVIGVKSPPFSAHSWVQREDLVLNDSVERVAPFTPILTI